MRNWLLVLLTVIATVPPATAFSDTAATGTFNLNINTGSIPFPTSGTVTWDDASYDVLGLSTVNLGTSVGTMDAFGSTSLNSGTPPAGTFTSTVSSFPLGLLEYTVNGDYVCPDAVGSCNGNFAFSFVGDVSGLFGVFVNSGPGSLPDLVTIHYTQDGFGDCIPDLGGFDCTGVLALNAFSLLNTPTGSNVTVTLDTTFFNPITGQTIAVEIDVTYAQVTTAGQTSVIPLSSAGGNVPANIIVSETGAPVVFLSVTTDALVVGPITLCGHYPDGDGDGIVDGSNGIRECDMRVLHAEGGTFVDRTMVSTDPLCTLASTTCPIDPVLGGRPCIDPGENVVCASVSSLSSLFLVAAQQGQRGPAPVPALPGPALAVAVLALVAATLLGVLRRPRRTEPPAGASSA